MTAMTSLALATVLVAARPEAGPLPVRDVHSAAMAAALFPFVQSIRGDRLEGAARRMLDARRIRIERCGQDARCVIAASIWTDDERKLLASAAPVASADRVAPDDGAAAQIGREVDGLNSILRVYGQGSPYPSRRFSPRPGKLALLPDGRQTSRFAGKMAVISRHVPAAASAIAASR